MSSYFKYLFIFFVFSVGSISHAAIVMTEGMTDEAFLKVVKQGPHSVYDGYSGRYTAKKLVKEPRATSSARLNRFDVARASAGSSGSSTQHYTSNAPTTEFGISFADRVQSHSR